MPAYKDYKDLLTEIDKLRPPPGSASYPDEFFKNVELLIRYGNFAKLGKGSSRTAYSFDADPRYVLKFSHNENGIRQSQTEIKNAKAGTSFAVKTVSPYVLKAVETYCDAYEQDVEFIGEDGRPVSFQDLMKKFSEPFGLMMHGPSWRPEANS